MWIPVLAAICLALIERSRISAALAATGVAAALPAVIAIPVPLRELLAQMLNGLQPAPDLSWGEIVSRYPAAIVDLLQADGGFVRDGAWYSAAYLLAGLGLLFVLARSRRLGARLDPDDGRRGRRRRLHRSPSPSSARCGWSSRSCRWPPSASRSAAERLAETAHAPAWLSPPNRKSGPARPASFADLRSESR